MAIIERERLYEVLVRFLPSGGCAAHQRRLTEVVRDGVVIAAQEGPALELVPGEVADVLGEALPALVLERDALAAAKAQLEQDLSAAARDIADKAEQLAQAANQLSAAGEIATSLATERDGLAAARADLEHDLSAAQGAVAALNEQVAEASSSLGAKDGRIAQLEAMVAALEAAQTEPSQG